MAAVIPSLDLTQDVVALTATLVDVPSESLHEHDLADAVEHALRAAAAPGGSSGVLVFSGDRDISMGGPEQYSANR